MSFPQSSFYFLHKYAVTNTPWAAELRKTGHEGGVNHICLMEEDKKLLLTAAWNQSQIINWQLCWVWQNVPEGSGILWCTDASTPCDGPEPVCCASWVPENSQGCKCVLWVRLSSSSEQGETITRYQAPGRSRHHELRVAAAKAEEIGMWTSSRKGFPLRKALCFPCPGRRGF